MSRETRIGLAIGGVTLAAMMVFAIGEALRWRRERDAQCAAAAPLVNARANISEVRKLPAGRPYEYSHRDAEGLLQSWGPELDKGRSISENLSPGRKLLLFQGDNSNSVMLVYFDEHDLALRVECFLQ